MRDLYVLIESYQRSPPAYIGDLARLVPTEHAEVDRLLGDSDRVAALREVRDYMSHRDTRRYYDVGRLAVAHVGLEWHRTLESAFAKMLLLGLRRARAVDAAGTAPRPGSES